MSKRLRDGYNQFTTPVATSATETVDDVDGDLPVQSKELVFSALSRTSLPPGACARLFLSRLATAEAVTVSESIAFREEYLREAYESAAAADVARQEAARAVESEAAALARQSAEIEATLANGGTLPFDSELSPEVASAAVDGANSVLRAYGISATAATVSEIVSGIAGGSDVTLPAPSLINSSAYTGRPLRGATSGVLYLSAERELGAAPPRRRDTWRYPFDANLVANAIDQAFVNDARESLKRPLWPDRSYPLGHMSSRVGAGSEHLRAVALAAAYDDAAADDSAISLLHARTLDALSQDIDEI